MNYGECLLFVFSIIFSIKMFKCSKMNNSYNKMNAYSVQKHFNCVDSCLILSASCSGCRIRCHGHVSISGAWVSETVASQRGAGIRLTWTAGAFLHPVRCKGMTLSRGN